jgi:hypothetical protein
MVHSPNLFFIANGNNPTGVGFTLGKTICFSSPEFTKDYPGHLSLSPLEGDSGIIFIGMVHSGSPSLDTTLEDSSDEGGAALGEGGELWIPLPPRMQCGNPDCFHQHHTDAGEHSNTPNHPDGHNVDGSSITRNGAPPRLAAELLGGAASADPCSVD